VKFAQGEREWYFFILEDENFPVGRNSNRCVGNGMGFWKSTPEIRIYNGDESMIATKRYLTFFSGSLPGAKKTHWTMEEYRLHVNGCITKQNIKVKLRINVFFETTFNLYGCIYIYIYMDQLYVRGQLLEHFRIF
jgi:hypothetical protein